MVAAMRDRYKVNLIKRPYAVVRPTDFGYSVWLYWERRSPVLGWDSDSAFRFTKWGVGRWIDRRVREHNRMTEQANARYIIELNHRVVKRTM